TNRRLRELGEQWTVADKPKPTVANSAPNGISISGGNVNNPTVNNFAPPRRDLSPAVTAELEQSLSLRKGTVFIGALISDNESVQFARKLYDAFKAAGWTMKDNTVRLVSLDAEWNGVRVGYHGARQADGATVEVPEDSLPGSVITALTKARVRGI